jgi:hypothetical protein
MRLPSSLGGRHEAAVQASAFPQEVPGQENIWRCESSYTHLEFVSGSALMRFPATPPGLDAGIDSRPLRVEDKNGVRRNFPFEFQP